MTVTKIETIGDLRNILRDLPDETAVSPLIIERHRPKMIRRSAAFINVLFGELRGERAHVVLALRPHEAMPDFEYAHEEHGHIGHDLGGEG
jgi:hypothetical protein